MAVPHDPYQPPNASLEGPSGRSSGEVPPSIVALLAQTRPWVKLLAILFFVGMGLGAIAVVVLLGVMPRPSAGPSPVVQLIPMLVIFLLYIPPVVFMWRYAAAIRKLQDGGALPALEEAIGSQKSFWKYIGVFTVVMMCLYGLFIVGAIGTGFFTRMNRPPPGIEGP